MVKLSSASLDTKDKAAKYIKSCEEDFEEYISAAVREILSRENLKAVTLSGPTCSGKTTTAGKLTREIERAGRHAKVISIDDFYRDSLRFEKEPDLESVSAIDLEYFLRCAENLSAGRAARLPSFDLSRGVRASAAEYIPSENDIYIFEGIQAMYPEVVECLSNFNSTSVFIDVTRGVSVDGEEFDKNEIRLMRRLIRDSLFRNAPAEFTLGLWDTVRKNEEKNIFPNSLSSDCFINSFLSYEIFVMRNRLLPTLGALDGSSSEYGAAQGLFSRLSRVGDCPIEDSMIPANSVFREFIG